VKEEKKDPGHDEVVAADAPSALEDDEARHGVGARRSGHMAAGGQGGGRRDATCRMPADSGERIQAALTERSERRCADRGSLHETD